MISTAWSYFFFKFVVGRDIMNLKIYQKFIRIMFIIAGIFIIILSAIQATGNFEFYDGLVQWIVYILLAMFIVILISLFLFWRCPYCGAMLGRMTFFESELYCQCCGQQIIKEEKNKNCSN